MEEVPQNIAIEVAEDEKSDNISAIGDRDLITFAEKLKKSVIEIDGYTQQNNNLTMTTTSSAPGRTTVGF